MPRISSGAEVAILSRPKLVLVLYQLVWLRLIHLWMILTISFWRCITHCADGQSNTRTNNSNPLHRSQRSSHCEITQDSTPYHHTAINNLIHLVEERGKAG